MGSVASLPPTHPDLLRDETLPYFLWWTATTVGEFRKLIRHPERTTRCYWMGALLREANSRDVWLFVSPRDVRELWPDVVRYLGRRKHMWAFLLQVPVPERPLPEEDRG